MQNNVTDLSQKLQRSLDNNYNVIDMSTVIEIISALEKTAVTKELLETTRLGKYINELRRRTSNESLAKRAKELLKKWRDLILPDANGQIASRSESPGAQRPSKKRSARTPPDAKGAKRPLNGQARELDFSDNSNCSIKDLKKTDVIFINSDSNSSLPDHTIDNLASNDALDLVDGSSNSVPKKRGRKKGSKNHKNLVIAAEESFSNKMAVSRNSKVKTTQELLADLQNRTGAPKGPTHQDIELRAAQLTESLSRIDQKLNPQKQINKNVTPIRNCNSTARPAPHRTVSEFQTWSRTSTPEVVTIQSDDEIVDVVGTDPPAGAAPPASSLLIKTELKSESPASPLTIEGLLSQLPPVDPSCLEEEDEVPPCECPLPPVVEDRITVSIVTENCEKSLFAPASPISLTKSEPEVTSEVVSEVKSEVRRTSESDFEELSENCPARKYLTSKYHLDVLSDSKLNQLHRNLLPNVNGNYESRSDAPKPEVEACGGLYSDIVPRLGAERLPKTPHENFQKYSISIAEDESARDDSCDRTEGAAPPGAESEFREWHETVDVRSYNGDLLRILPYVIID